MRKAKASLKNIEDCIFALKIYNSFNVELLNTIDVLDENIDELFEMTERIEKLLWKII